MGDILGLTAPAPLSLSTLAFNLVLSLALSGILGWFYARYGASFSNRARFAQVLPLLSLTTVLIISVVKSSLALSLGLVGALSIVRFRTAIKEPEELLYLFAAISIGLGLGADQRWPTVLAVAVFVGYVFLRTWLTPRRTVNNLYLNLSTPQGDQTFEQAREVLLKHAAAVDLRRLDTDPQRMQATYLIHCASDAALVALMDELRTRFPESECSFVEQDTTLGA